MATQGVHSTRLISSRSQSDLVRGASTTTNFHLSGGHLKYSMKNVGRTHVSDNTSLSYFEYIIQHHQEALVKA
ncbi:hypothetical protein Scep_019292 [Stephania cephalantha]|uniref:Uncharacterized protein n=1 Tax=Stephania cephalantha TaxID=152367 RepID=A0AAP0NM06_9MAGN